MGHEVQFLARKADLIEFRKQLIRLNSIYFTSPVKFRREEKADQLEIVSFLNDEEDRENEQRK